MPALVFRLRNVPVDEADAVRHLMEENHIQWYETSAGNWGIAMPGIWVNDADDLPKARSLIDTYQQERTALQRSQYQQEMESGHAATLAQRFRQYPFRTVGIVLFCLFILYVSVNPILQMIGYSKNGLS